LLRGKVGLDLDWLDVPGAGVLEKTCMLGPVIKVIFLTFKCRHDSGTINDSLGGCVSSIGRKRVASSMAEKFGCDGRDWPVPRDPCLK
jgi:hypothetical protein